VHKWVGESYRCTAYGIGISLIARAINGFLLRESWSFQRSNATEEGRYAPDEEGG